MIYNCICFLHKECSQTMCFVQCQFDSSCQHTNLYLAAPSQAEWANAGTPQKRPHPPQIPVSTHVPTESHNALSPKTDCNGTRSRGRSAALQHQGVCVAVRTSKMWGNRGFVFLVEALCSQLSSWYFRNVISPLKQSPQRYTLPKIGIAPEKWKLGRRSCLSFWEAGASC